MIEPINRVAAEVRTLPMASRIGLAVLVVAGAMDVTVHLFGIGMGTGGHHHGFVPEHAAHVIGIVGMVLVLAGVVFHGARRHPGRHRSAATTGGLDRNAPR